MNIIKLDTSKMSWTRTEMGATDFKLLGLSISFTDENYFNNIFIPILKNLVNVDFRFIIVKNTASEKYTWNIDLIKFVGYDLVRQQLKAGVTYNNVLIQGLIREAQNTLGNITNHEIYILYK